MARFGVDPRILFNFIREAGLKPYQTANSYVFDCPRCHGKKKLYIRKSDGRFVCWFCKERDNYQGNPAIALADLTARSVREIKVRLYGSEDVAVRLYLDARAVDFFSDDEEIDEDARSTPTTTWPWDYYPIDHTHSARGAQYLRGRGIPLWLAVRYGIRYCPQRRRVVFPVAERDNLYGWQERIVIPNVYVDEQGKRREIPKILSSTGIPRDRTLMFADRLESADHAILCEGPVDAIKAHFCGGNVAAMGKAVSREQVRLLRNAGVRKLYLALDPDAAKEIAKLVKDNFDDFEMYEMVPKLGADKKIDLGGMSFEEVDELFRRAPRIGAGRLFSYISYKY